MHQTPVSLLERLKHPMDQEAWSRFVYLYSPLVFSWAGQVGLQEADAADLVQEVFILLLQKMPEFAYDPQGSFRAWLKAVTLNKWREQRRRAAARPEAGAELLAEPAVSAASEAFWEAEYRQHLVTRALESMQVFFEPGTWQACWEVVVAGRPPAEVAAQLGVSVATVYSAKCRVLARLRHELAGMMD